MYTGLAWSRLVLMLCPVLVAGIPAVRAEPTGPARVLVIPDRTEPERPFSPTVPAQHWAYVALDKLREVFVGCNLGGRSSTLTRYEFSFAIAWLLDGHVWKSGRYSWHLHPSEAFSIGDAGLRDIMASLKREFAPELAKLSVPVPGFQGARVQPGLEPRP